MSKHHKHGHHSDSDSKGYKGSALETIEQMKNLHPSESTRVQDEKKNTETGKVINPTRLDAEIEIVTHATPGADAAVRGMEAVDKATGTELADGIEAAPDGHDYTSGNSITGEVKPKPFHPWDDAIAKDETAKEELIETRKQAAKPATNKGQV